MDYAFDRFLTYDDLRAWLEDKASEHPHLMTLETYGRSHEGRDLLLATLTDAATGPAADKPAHWVDANIHAVEVTAGVAALWLIERLLTGYGADEAVTRALRTRTFYAAPRVNPDGVEWALATPPRYRRSSVRPWPWGGDVRAAGLAASDIDGDGRVLTMRVPDPTGAWTPSASDPRIMAPVPPDGLPADAPRYRLLTEGLIEHYDSFTIPTPRPREGLDLNRNFPAGWSTKVTGSGDHPLSEPEIEALVRAVKARPNVCGYNAYHTAAGVLLRPSSTKPDADLPPLDLWTYRRLGEKGTALTGYGVHSSFEDFTFDKADLMSGAGDDWAYEHLGVYAWTTEFWDVLKQATGEPTSGEAWVTGATEAQQVAVLAWLEARGLPGWIDWYPFEHPQLGPVELGGWDGFGVWTNPPLPLLADEVRPHADFAVVQAFAAPCLEILAVDAQPLGAGVWRVAAGVANTGYLPTTVTQHADREKLVLPLVVTLSDAAGADLDVVGGTARQELGQLAGRSAARFSGDNDGTPERVLATWTVRAPAGTVLTVTASHQRAGRATARIPLG